MAKTHIDSNKNTIVENDWTIRERFCERAEMLLTWATIGKLSKRSEQELESLKEILPEITGRAIVERN